MAIRLIAGNANLGGVTFSILGDGTSTDFTIDLQRAPFALDFVGNAPTGIELCTFVVRSRDKLLGYLTDSTFTATATTASRKAIITLNKPLPASTPTKTWFGQVALTFIYTV